MKKQISYNLHGYRYLIVILGIGLLVFAILDFFKLIEVEKSGNMNMFVAILIVELIFIVLIYFINQSKTVEYDDNLLYVFNKEQSKEIPLEKIEKIKLTTRSINDENMWKICFKESNGKSDSVTFLPNNNFDAFKKAVLSKNDKVIIKNWSHSFDLD